MLFVKFESTQGNFYDVNLSNVVMIVKRGGNYVIKFSTGMELAVNEENYKKITKKLYKE